MWTLESSSDDSSDLSFYTRDGKPGLSFWFCLWAWPNPSHCGRSGNGSVNGSSLSASSSLSLFFPHLPLHLCLLVWIWTESPSSIHIQKLTPHYEVQEGGNSSSSDCGALEVGHLGLDKIMRVQPLWLDAGGLIKRERATRQAHILSHVLCLLPPDLWSYALPLPARRPSPDAAPWIETSNTVSQDKFLFFNSVCDFVSFSSRKKDLCTHIWTNGPGEKLRW